MVAFGRNIGTGKELKSFSGGIWKQYCDRRGTVAKRQKHLEPFGHPSPQTTRSLWRRSTLWPVPFGAGLWRFWSRSAGRLVQVDRSFGAGVTFGNGPAPPQDAESCFAVQVIALSPHLRQSGHIPAPRKAFTCANWRGHLRQEHGLADRSMEQVVRYRTGNTCAWKHLICSCIWENGEERGRRCTCERWCAGYVRLSAATPGRKWS